MRSGGPRNTTGPIPQERELAQRPGLPVGEWLNKVIQPSGADDAGAAGQPARSEPTMRRGGPYRDVSPSGPEEYRVDGDNDAGDRGHGAEHAPDETTRTCLSLDELHMRLDEITDDLGRLARMEAMRQRPPAAPSRPFEARKQRPSAAPPRRRAASAPVFSVEEAVAEITARQRILDGGSVAPDSPAAPPARSATDNSEQAAAGTDGNPATDDPADAASASVPAAAMAGVGSLEDQLREITARIEALRPAGDLAAAVAAIRTDLAELGRQIDEALPRRAVESLEMEVKALAERVDQSRQSGSDSNALSGLEQGLIDIREALRALTPAESLVGFADAVNALSQKLDAILSRDDPSTLPQLEAAIDSLRAVVSHVASNDSVTRVAEDVRALANQVDIIAN
ncbi:MAG: hypothetical protein WBF58_01890, partial [Xanthobacteraceae bacterium]